MNLKKTISILTVSALGIAAVLGVVAYKTANAQAATPTAPSTTLPGGKEFGLLGRGFAGGYTNEDLANALGITVDQLNTATQQADDAALAQAVQDGLITQAQADELKARGSAFPFGGRWEGWLSQSGIDYNALLANALGITVDQLNAAYTQAFNARIDQAVANGNLTQDQADLMKGQHALFSNQNFQSAMQSAFEASVKQAVTDGVITQAQADLILQNQSGMGFPGFHGDAGFGGPHGPGGPGGFGGAPVNPASPSTPSATPSSGL